jgi:hypothetical protein
MFYSSEHKAVVYPNNPPWLGAQVCASIPGAQPINGSYFTIPATLHALRIARLLGLPVPAIMDTLGYSWSRQPGIEPFAHQRHMANFKVLHPRSFDLSQMRTGKTLGALWAADFLIEHGEAHRWLVICPLSNMDRVYAKELFRSFVGRRTFAILHGDQRTRLQRLAEPRDFYIINHDGFKSGAGRNYKGQGRGFHVGRLAQELIDREDIDGVIIDEASAYRDARSLRSQVLQRIVGRPNEPGAKKFAWAMTGTPTPRAPVDAYGVAKILGSLGDETFTRFKARTMYQVSQFKWLPTRNAQEAVTKALQPAIRYSRAECIDLPPATFETLDVPLSDAQEKAYAEMRKELSLTLKTGKQITAFNEATLRGKLIQIACGCVYGENHTSNKIDFAPRLDALKEVLDEAGGKILVFMPLTGILKLVYAELKDELGEDAVEMVYGDISPAKRTEIFRRFDEDENLRVIAAHPAVMSHGLDLSVADTIVWWSPIDDLEIFDQACARIDGPRQKKNMLVIQMAGSPVEREIYKRLSEKTAMQGAILSMVEANR